MQIAQGDESCSSLLKAFMVVPVYTPKNPVDVDAIFVGDGNTCIPLSWR